MLEAVESEGPQEAGAVARSSQGPGQSSWDLDGGDGGGGGGD